MPALWRAGFGITLTLGHGSRATTSKSVARLIMHGY